MPLIGRIAAATARGYGLFANVVQAVDPFFNYVVALLHGDGTNGGQNNTFLDSSTNNFTITRNGNTTQGAFSPFSQTGWSGYFDGNGDSLTFTNQGTTTAFTCECWFYRGEDVGGYHIIFGGSNASNVNPNNVQLLVGNTGTVGLTLNGSAVIAATGTSVAKNQWNHIAWVRSGTSCAIFVNGFRIATGSSSAALNVDRIGTTGGLSAGTYDARGYISNARITTTAVYDPSLTTCTVPTAPLTAVTGTYLLTLQSNRFVDNSASPLTITRNGDTSIQPFSPFNPTTPYSTSSIGGSGYFDGAGDNLDIAHNAVLTPAGDFTIEFWAYPLTASSIREWYTKGIGIQVYSNGAAWGLALSSNNSGTYYINATFGTLIANAWQHIVITRSGNSYVGFVNGVATSFGTSSSAPGTGTDALRIGDLSVSGGYPVFGYMSGVRYVNGTAVYGTSTFTPPTSPPTAVTNTQLLTNFTNGAIFDNAAVADYETVGNAQISTSVKKYGTGSMAFDGTGDWLTAADSQSFNFGTGDFTIEFWAYWNSFGSDRKYVLKAVSGTNYWQLSHDSSTGISFNYNAGSGQVIVAQQGSNNSWSTATWYHVALVRCGSTIKIYQNGTQVASGTLSVALPNPAVALTVGGTPVDSSLSMNGYIDDLRISKGIGRYPYNFTPPTAEFPNIGGTVTLTADPYFDYTTLLLPGNGTNGAQNNTFLDSSTNNFTITRNGNTTQGTFSPFSQTGWGNFFDGNGDYLQPTANSAFAFGTGNFTVECWIYVTDANDDGIYEGRSDGVTADGFTLTAFSSSVIRMYTSSALITASGLSYLNQWTHVALVCNAGTTTLYINGVSAGSTTTVTNCTNTGPVIGIGRYSTSTAPTAASSLNGYISNFRAVKGTAVYTSNFTPPTTPLTAITNTSLLTCQNNRFIDNSTNAFAITAAGNVSVQAFSPFNPTAAWSASTNGGSGYFDGSGDALYAPANAAFNFGAPSGNTNDFTVEMWVYPLNFSNIYFLYGTGPSGGADQFYLNTDGRAYYFDGASQVSSPVLTTNSWNHLALVRNGSGSNNIRVYGNGVSGTAVTSSTSLGSSVNSPYIGSRSDGSYPLPGYISSLRVVKGTAVYTTGFTPPTAPLTAITNTSLLTNFTNAGIYDATAKNDLETVGNAQISTTQSKFGGSSMLFDGNGDDLKIITNPPLSFSGFAGDFTIEAWVYPTATGQSNGSYVCAQTTSGSYGPIVILQSSGTYNFVIYMSSTGSSWNLASAVSCGTATANAWNHIAVTRYGTNVYCFMNGILQSTTAVSTTALMTTSANWHIGSADLVVNSYLTGYVDDFRITRGIARYTSNFTPPTTAFLTL